MRKILDHIGILKLSKTPAMRTISLASLQLPQCTHMETFKLDVAGDGEGILSNRKEPGPDWDSTEEYM